MTDKPRPPMIQPGWKTGRQLKIERGGDNTRHDQRIRQWREILVKEVAEQVTSGNMEEADALVDANLIGMRWNLNKPAMAASPDMLQIMNEQRPNPIPPGWKAIRAKESAYQQVVKLCDEILQEITTKVTRGNADEAQSLMEIFFARNHREGPGYGEPLIVSPLIQEALDLRIKYRAQDDWLTAAQRCDALGGLDIDHLRAFELLRKRLIDEIAEQYTRGDTEYSEALVNDHLIGKRIDIGKHSLHASPAAQRILDEQLPQQSPAIDKQNLHPLPAGWETPSMRLVANGRKRHLNSYRYELEDLRDRLIEDVTEKLDGIDRDHAVNLVTNHLIGMYKHCGRPMLAASPDAQRILNEQWQGRTKYNKNTSPSKD